MNITEAKEHIIHEGTSIEGIAVTVRMGEDPGHDRIMRIIKAIDILLESEDLDAPIDREIAFSLFVIAHETDVQSWSWQTDRQWREGEFLNDLFKLQQKVEEYFLGNLEFVEDA